MPQDARCEGSEIETMPNLDNQTIQLAIVAVVALAMLLQTIVLLAIFVTVRKAARSMRDDIEDLRSSVLPVIDNVHELFVRSAPRIEAAAIDLAVMSHNLRAQTADVQSAATEIIERVRRQSARVDSSVSSIFDAIDRATSFMSDAVAKPMRQLSGVLASIKAVVESLRTDPHGPHVPGTHPRGDNDMFV
jgi:methyl-accepting chemotaxis protein